MALRSLLLLLLVAFVAAASASPAGRRSSSPCRLTFSAIPATSECVDSVTQLTVPAPTRRECKGACTGPNFRCLVLSKDADMICKDQNTGVTTVHPRHRTCACGLPTPAAGSDPLAAADDDTRASGGLANFSALVRNNRSASDSSSSSSSSASTAFLLAPCRLETKIYTCWTGPNNPTLVQLKAKQCGGGCQPDTVCVPTERDPDIPCYVANMLSWLPQHKRCACA